MVDMMMKTGWIGRVLQMMYTTVVPSIGVLFSKER